MTTAEAALVDGWLELAVARRRRNGDHILLPVLSGVFGTALAALALADGFSQPASYALGGVLHW